MRRVFGGETYHYTDPNRTNFTYYEINETKKKTKKQSIPIKEIQIIEDINKIHIVDFNKKQKERKKKYKNVQVIKSIKNKKENKKNYIKIEHAEEKTQQNESFNPKMKYVPNYYDDQKNKILSSKPDISLNLQNINASNEGKQKKINNNENNNYLHVSTDNQIQDNSKYQNQYQCNFQTNEYQNNEEEEEKVIDENSKNEEGNLGVFPRNKTRQLCKKDLDILLRFFKKDLYNLDSKPTPSVYNRILINFKILVESERLYILNGLKNSAINSEREERYNDLIGLLNDKDGLDSNYEEIGGKIKVPDYEKKALNYPFHLDILHKAVGSWKKKSEL